MGSRCTCVFLRADVGLASAFGWKSAPRAVHGENSRMGATAAVMRSKRGSPLTRASLAFGSFWSIHASLLDLARGSSSTSGGDKDEVCGWERMPADKPDVPFGGGGELGSANSSGWCRGPAKTNMRICTGKGSVVVVDLSHQWRQRSSRGDGLIAR